MIVYFLKDPNDLQVRYVGITSKTTEERLRGHIRDARTRPDLNRHKTNWILKLQSQNKKPIIKTIAVVDTVEEAKALEVYFISVLKDRCILINKTAGGDYMSPKIHSRESVLKNPKIRPVIQYNIFGEIVGEYLVTEDAARDNGLKSASKITACCGGYRRHAHGYIWRYKGDEVGDLSNFDINSIYFSWLVQMDYNGNVINRWDSLRKASECVGDGSKGGNIFAAAIGKQSCCKGFIWKFEYKLKRGPLKTSLIR